MLMRWLGFKVVVAAANVMEVAGAGMARVRPQPIANRQQAVPSTQVIDSRDSAIENTRRTKAIMVDPDRTLREE